ncbi:hypothetical protein LTR99_003845 [Exophiala xenobiotica]|uniref:NADPH--hemoprotein reductase n=1 Tax=Vermiconidia calcicola TaxID=1690605 RepID=A0AAV9PUQ8_9PEZI|nr:hypothetical protein H2202_002516 [Exophiala xenobiotica]KAK5528745.1 hypothetical protein LTR23_010954 [Chaetothyriales sp. CCFEE 6169]KAK5529836.1 hypothetical protein LTR25_009616 [Vermiconidia calcicola]KAK5189156.1 hypothetical protein LTR92_010845 [Exophiala xenobiotica]KAK5230825.1 hypothetical protein LTR72_000004 [Exophiala xenobiotica]
MDSGIQGATTLLTSIRRSSHMLLPPKVSLALQQLDIWDQFGLILLLALFYTFLPGSAPEKGWFEIIWGANGKDKIQNENSRNIVKVLEKTGADVVVFFGSQSGRSERLANSLSRDLTTRYKVKALVADLDDFDHNYLQTFPGSKLAIFFLATFGEGDPTDNATGFLEVLSRWSRDRVDPKQGSLRNLKYCVFGLGNSSYKYYNKCVDVVDAGLSLMGGTRLGPVGKGDEARGTVATDEDFMWWRDIILPIVAQKFNLTEVEYRYEPEILVESTTVDPAKVYLGERSSAQLEATASTTINHRNPYGCPVAQSKELYTDPSRNCLHMEFDLSGVPELKYQSGDHLAIWPTNPQNEVNRIMELLGLDEYSRTEPVVVRFRDDIDSEHLKIPLPSPTTRESIFKYYLEICGPVSPDLLNKFLQYAPTEKAKAALSTLIDSRETFNQFVTLQCSSIARIMEFADPEAKWQVPMGFFVEGLGRLQPRYYSVASSPAMEPRKPAITAVVTAKAITTRSSSENKSDKMYGVATNYLLALKHSMNQEDRSSNGLIYDLDGPRNKLVGGKVFLHIRHSSFKLPANNKTPIIMVAAGTGIAPFRGFVQERVRIATAGQEVGPMLLFFGCRSPEHDYLYSQEWEKTEQMLGKHRFRIITAFSRQQQKRLYVQDKLEEHGELVAKMLNDGAYFYICGSTDMARGVRQALVKVMMQANGYDEKAADNYVRYELKQARRFQEDVWSV